MSSESALPESIEALAMQVRKAKLPSPATRKRIREEAGVSVRAAARAISVDPMTVLRWEQGTTPRPEHAVAYRQLLDALEAASA